MAAVHVARALRRSREEFEKENGKENEETRGKWYGNARLTPRSSLRASIASPSVEVRSCLLQAGFLVTFF